MSFFQTLGEGYKIMGQEAKQKVVDNRANIFTGVSVIGTIATAIISWINGGKSARAIDAESARLQRELTLKEKAQVSWKHAIVPTVTVAGACAGSITSNRIMSGDIARLTTDVAVVTKAYNDFKKATNEVIDEKKQKQVQHVIGDQQREEIDQKTLDKLPEPDRQDGAPRCPLIKEPISRIVFFQTEDKIAAVIAQMREEMALLKPRNREAPLSQWVHGVHLSRFLEGVAAISPEELSISKKTDTILDNYGWNKGYWKDGINDDDQIGCDLEPGEVIYKGEKRLCYIIDWHKMPSDMMLGNKLKDPNSIYYERAYYDP